MNDDKQARSEEFREQMIAKWRNDLKRIQNDVITLHGSRKIYKRLFEIMDANPRLHKANELYEWLHRSYVVYASMAIRRVLKPHKGSLSLGGLVHNMIDHEHVLTKEWYLSQCEVTADWDSREDYLDWFDANEDFDKLVGAGKDTVDGQDLQRRLDEARLLSCRVLEYADKLVAHTDRKPPDTLPTYPGLDSAIDAVGDLFKHLDTLINQGSFISLEPIGVSPWERLFEEPWIVRPERS